MTVPVSGPPSSTELRELDTLLWDAVSVARSTGVEAKLRGTPPQQTNNRFENHCAYRWLKGQPGFAKAQRLFNKKLDGLCRRVTPDELGPSSFAKIEAVEHQWALLMFTEMVVSSLAIYLALKETPDEVTIPNKKMLRDAVKHAKALIKLMEGGVRLCSLSDKRWPKVVAASGVSIEGGLRLHSLFISRDASFLLKALVDEIEAGRTPYAIKHKDDSFLERIFLAELGFRFSYTFGETLPSIAAEIVGMINLAADPSITAVTRGVSAGTKLLSRLEMTSSRRR